LCVHVHQLRITKILKIPSKPLSLVRHYKLKHSMYMDKTSGQGFKAIGNHSHILAPKNYTCRSIKQIKLHCF
jgi:hypothetical protein